MREPVRDKERLAHIDAAIDKLVKGTKESIDIIEEGSLEILGL